MYGNEKVTDAEQEKLFHKVRKLLEKAESTAFEEEADAFIRKAQELILRYSIDEEELWAQDPSRRKAITQITIKIPDRMTGAHHRRIIVNVLANLNQSKCWYERGKGETYVAGFPNDLIFIEMLYTSILTQMNFKMAIAQAVDDGNTHARVFRNNFQDAFAATICNRLKAMYSKARDSVDSETGKSTELVLVDRKTQVDKWVQENIGRLGRGASSNAGKYSHTARAQGTHAANETDISGGRRGMAKPKGELGA